MRSLSVALSLTVLLATAAVFATPNTTFAQSPSAIATISLWNDTDADGQYGSAGDVLLDQGNVNADGSYSLNATGCDDCGAVIIDWGWDDPEIDSVGGIGKADGNPLSSGEVKFWYDSDNNGVFGTSGDSLASSTTIDPDFAIENVTFGSAAVVITGWGWDDPEIDSISGTILGWGWDDPEIDSQTTEIDWGFGDDEIDAIGATIQS